MSETYSQCPKCNYKPAAPLPISEPCPECGIFTFKWGQPPHISVASNVHDEAFSEEGGYIASLLNPLEKMDSHTFYGRCVVLLLFAWWSWYLIGYDYRDGEIGGSFMHNILLPIHEAGHVLFSPFGEFMMILGGSLFQLVLPLGIGIAFVVVNRDNFGAAICLWWTSVSLVDLSPYIYDALQPQLILLGGHTGEDGPHDWIYLLGTFGQIPNVQHWGSLAHALGSVFVIASLAWAVALLWKQRGRTDSDKYST
jgi:hypothetical protein